MSKTYGVVFLVLFSLSPTLHAQPTPDTLWTTHFGNPSGTDVGSFVFESSDGGYFAGGTSTLSTSMILSRLDSLGNTLWSRLYYNGYFQHRAYDAVPTLNGGAVMAGSTDWIGAGMTDAYLICVDQNGDTIWTRTFGGSWHDVALAMVATQDSGFLVTGYVSELQPYDKDLFVFKCDNNGEILWSIVVGGDEPDEGKAIVATVDGGALAVGYTMSAAEGQSYIYAVRLTQSGDVLWERYYDQEGLSEARGVALSGDDGFVIVGTEGYISCALLVDLNGTELWHRTYGGLTGNVATDVLPSSQGSFMIVGDMYVPPLAARQFYLMRIDTLGNMLWRIFYGLSGDESLPKLARTADSGYVLCGGSTSFNLLSDIFVVKTGREQLSGVPPRDQGLASTFVLTIFPNPFNAVTTISLSLPTASDFELSVFDMTGRYVHTLHEGILNAGEHRIGFDAGSLPSGIYFARMEMPSQLSTQKLLLIK